MNQKKHTQTPAIKIVRQLAIGVGSACVLELPVGFPHSIIQLDQLPKELGFPLSSPRPAYFVSNDKEDNFPGSGAHAHTTGTEKEIMCVLWGRAMVYLWNQKGNMIAVELKPAKKGEKMQALFIPDGIWHTVRYDPETVLAVVASENYDRAFYIEKPENYFTTPEALEAYRRTFPTLPQ